MLRQRGVGGVITTAPVADASVAENTAAPVVDPNKVYKLGDTGPAGGLIFYDKGNNLDGWRYMEAAPANTEKRFAWWVQRYLKEVPSNAGAYDRGFEIGNGKTHTQRLMKLVNDNCGIYNNELPAILYCSTLEVNGYKDWFLPSVNELKLMRRNLHIRGLGNFNDENYWSSNVGGPGSTGIDNWWFYFVDFRYGEHKGTSGNGTFRVRAARRF